MHGSVLLGNEERQIANQRFHSFHSISTYKLANQHMHTTHPMQICEHTIAFVDLLPSTDYAGSSIVYLLEARTKGKFLNFCLASGATRCRTCPLLHFNIYTQNYPPPCPARASIKFRPYVFTICIIFAPSACAHVPPTCPRSRAHPPRRTPPRARPAASWGPWWEVQEETNG